MDLDGESRAAARQKGEALRQEMANWEKRMSMPEKPFADREQARNTEPAEEKSPVQEQPTLRRGRTNRDREEDRER